MTQIINHTTPSIANCISHILGYDELTFSDDQAFVYKDLFLLQKNRTGGANKVVICGSSLFQSCIDPNITGVDTKSYTGGINYPHIMSLIMYAKQYNQQKGPGRIQKNPQQID
jgi:hypothetical protein